MRIGVGITDEDDDSDHTWSLWHDSDENPCSISLLSSPMLLRFSLWLRGTTERYDRRIFLLCCCCRRDRLRRSRLAWWTWTIGWWRNWGERAIVATRLRRFPFAPNCGAFVILRQVLVEITELISLSILQQMQAYLLPTRALDVCWLISNKELVIIRLDEWIILTMILTTILPAPSLDLLTEIVTMFNDRQSCFRKWISRSIYHCRRCRGSLLREVNTGSSEDWSRLFLLVVQQKRVQQLLEVENIAVDTGKHNVLVGSRLEWESILQPHNWLIIGIEIENVERIRVEKASSSCNPL